MALLSCGRRGVAEIDVASGYKVPEKNRSAAAMYFAKLNCRLSSGFYMLNMDSGEVRARQRVTRMRRHHLSSCQPPHPLRPPVPRFLPPPSPRAHAPQVRFHGYAITYDAMPNEALTQAVRMIIAKGTTQFVEGVNGVITLCEKYKPQGVFRTVPAVRVPDVCAAASAVTIK